VISRFYPWFGVSLWQEVRWCTSEPSFCIYG